MTCLFISRVIPLVVVIYRVLMVCHVEFCFKHGEKVIRDKLFRCDNYIICYASSRYP